MSWTLQLHPFVPGTFFPWGRVDQEQRRRKCRTLHTESPGKFSKKPGGDLNEVRTMLQNNLRPTFPYNREKKGGERAKKQIFQETELKYKDFSRGNSALQMG